MILTILSAGLYNTNPPMLIVISTALGALGLIGVSIWCFSLMRGAAVGAGMNADSFEEVIQKDVSADDYFDHAIGTIYPKAIRDSKDSVARQADRLNYIYVIEGGAIVWILLSTTILATL
ncbi:hypothetical protein [Halarchaeum sp. P4]|uniref:hypothetical protein n=1 Tax=Halarchaeum sp. P4 TaxID=3421639 RepID=UPI003EBE94EB